MKKVQFGSIWGFFDADFTGDYETYIFAQVGCRMFCLVNLRTGNRMADPILIPYSGKMSFDGIYVSDTAWKTITANRDFFLVRSGEHH